MRLTHKGTRPWSRSQTPGAKTNYIAKQPPTFVRVGKSTPAERLGQESHSHDLVVGYPAAVTRTTVAAASAGFACHHEVEVVYEDGAMLLAALETINTDPDCAQT